MLSLIIRSTILILSALCEMYSEQRITYREFIKLTEVKINFLIENLDKVSADDERKSANDVIKKCKSLISKSNERMATDVYCFSSDILQ